MVMTVSYYLLLRAVLLTSVVPSTMVRATVFVSSFHLTDDPESRFSDFLDRRGRRRPRGRRGCSWDDDDERLRQQFYRRVKSRGGGGDDVETNNDNDKKKKQKERDSGEDADKNSDEGGSKNCHLISVLLTTEDTEKGFIDGFNDYSEIAFGTIQGGTVRLSNPENSQETVGEYTALTTFLGSFDAKTFEVDCADAGAYQFGPGEQIAFSATCAGLPYFTITGGQGRYFGAYGHVEFMIPHPEGFVHEIHVCTRLGGDVPATWSHHQARRR